ncbi:MAG: Holliday junction resolvase RuvX [Propionibacteriaceae bacterium]|nr:Holliday junction resolvase RuvX [Propionibacteriaceae bacterium]
MRLALDWGAARIGIAACDAAGLLAYPVETVPNDAQTLTRIAALVEQYQPVELVMGLPLDLRGQEAVAARNIRERAQEVADGVQLPIRLLDERLTTAQAAKQLRASGRNARKAKGVIDQAAAVALLWSLLESNTDQTRAVIHPQPGAAPNV